MIAMPQLRIAGSAEPHWLSVSDAAQRTGYTDRHIRRLCDGWAEKGQARRNAADQWEIRDDALPTPQNQTASVTQLVTLTDAQRDVALGRQKIIDGWCSAIAAGFKQNKTKTQSTQTYLARLKSEGVNISERTLWGWQEKYSQDGLPGLVDGRHVKARGTCDGDPFFQYFSSIWLQPRPISIRIAWEVATQRAIEMGWEQRSYSQTKSYVDRLDPALVTKKREGEKAFVDKHEPNIRRDYSTIDSNSWWVSDHHRFDVMILHPDSTPEKPKYCRPWVTGWEDVRSRKIIGWRVFIHDPNTDTILGAFCDAAEKYGLPKISYQDNGKDYDSKAIQGMTKKERRQRNSSASSVSSVVNNSWQSKLDTPRISGAFNLLQIQVVHAWPYHGQSKGIERRFRIVCEQFSMLQDCYCGNSTDSPVRDITTTGNINDQLSAGKALTLSEFTQVR